MKNKKLKSLLMIVIILVVVILGFIWFLKDITLAGNVDDTKYIVEVSKVYSEEEIEEAMDVICEEFKHTFYGCTLKELQYNDEDYLDESNAWSTTYDGKKTIVINSVFNVSGKGASLGFNPNSIYTQYRFILVEENGTWIIRNKGMG